MKSMTLRISAAAMMCVGLASVASAQPRLVITGIGSGDLAANGNGVSGHAYDADLQEYVPYIWVRGDGFTRIPGAYLAGGNAGVVCSGDLSVLAMTSDNIANWAELNCFNGYNTTTGLPNPPHNDPCPMRLLPHRWTASTGWVNTGSFDRVADPITGRMVGGTHCDSTISTLAAISDNGRFVLANGYFVSAFRPDGSISSGVCGSFYPYIYDAVTGDITQLPVQPGTVTSRADRINADGTVMTGYDLNSAESFRRTCVWRDGVQTILDGFLGAKDNAGVNSSGDVLASGGSTQFIAATFPGEIGVRLVRWVWDGSAYIPENLGVPEAHEEMTLPFSDLWVTGISADGNTIVGNAQWGPPPPTIGGIRRPFIWNPSINNGQPIDLEAYLATIDNPSDPIFSFDFTMTFPTALSDDGNAILVSIYDARNTCAEPAASLTTFRTGVLYLDGSQIPCDAPHIGLSPKDWAEASDYNFGSALNVTASGSWPLSYQWQREDPANPGTWIDLADSCSNFDDSNWDYEGTQTVQLRVGQHYAGSGRSGNYRVVVSNPCGAVVSEPATLTHVVGPCCIAGNSCYIDYQAPCAQVGGIWLGAGASCDIEPCQFAPCCQTDGTCIETLVSVCSESGGTPGTVGDNCFFVTCEPACLADYNGNGGTDVPDIFDFLTDWFAGNPAAYSFGGTPGVPAIFAFLTAWFAGC